ncbi:MAG: hypothetical protein F4087_05935 [Gemmatimonadetes bacterium]|nr:hypothetical protein [Acidobacteriota bacterium]MYE68910.1 hypothetical protein [Gemmatimonadota bacterium]MXZ61104.1 hypothetical protein [Acidobacteriota bacterium]MYA44783.1 hypothetical protein [Acidobacteriota bacterium]MYI40091.1 hypothetical protein [Acidobacteriota bacterium]
MVTSNRPVAEWGRVFGDAVVATAVLDRVLRHSHVIAIRGESFRLRERRRSGLFRGFASLLPFPGRQHSTRPRGGSVTHTPYPRGGVRP